MDDVGAGPEHAKECDRVPGRVRHIERDRMAAIDAHMPESCRRACGLVAQAAVADASVLIFKRRAIAEIRNSAVEQFLQRGGRNRAVPAHAGRVGFFPRIGASDLRHASRTASALKLQSTLGGRRRRPYTTLRLRNCHSQPPTSPLMRGPNNSQRSPLNRSICICLIGAKSFGPVLILEPGSSMSSSRFLRLAACFMTFSRVRLSPLCLSTATKVCAAR